MEIDFLRQAIAVALTEARHAAQLTQPQLADFAQLSRSYIAAVEAGKVGISCETMYSLLTVLQISPIAFFQRVEELRAQKPVLSNPGRGGRRTVAFVQKHEEDEIHGKNLA